MGHRTGYVRVSTPDQNPQRQLDGIQVGRVFIEYASGKHAERPQLKAAMEYCREGDTLVVLSMDRLARNVRDLLRIVEELNERHIAVEFVKERLTFTGKDSPMSQLMLTIMAAVAQFERAIILERQRDGIAIAKSKKLYKGRRPKLTPAQVAAAKDRLNNGGGIMSEVAKAFGVSRPTLYRYLRDEAPAEARAAVEGFDIDRMMEPKGRGGRRRRRRS